MADLASEMGAAPDVEITVSVPAERPLALKDLNPPGAGQIEGGFPILGTNGGGAASFSRLDRVVSRGIDVAPGLGAVPRGGAARGPRA